MMADGREEGRDGRWEGWQMETATMADGRKDPDGSNGRQQRKSRQQRWQRAEQQ